MEIMGTVYTIGTAYSFSFSGGGNFDFGSIEDIVPEMIVERISEALSDAFWESMNGEEPEKEILELLKKDPRYQSVLAMEDAEKEKFTRAYVAEILVSTETSYKADEIDITNFMGNEAGVWNDFIFDTISEYVLYELQTINPKE